MNEPYRTADLWWSREIVRIAGFARGQVPLLTPEARAEIHEAALKIAEITRPHPGEDAR